MEAQIMKQRAKNYCLGKRNKDFEYESKKEIG